MLKERELATFSWDNKLILEFNGKRPAVAGVDIRRNDAALTVFIAADSTVTDQPGEPWCGWGQMLPRFFPAGVAIANHAESGLSLATFRGAGRLEKILNLIKPGDYVFIQFGHNDQKETGEGVGAYTTYASGLRDYIAAIREKGGEPVLITSMYRRRFTGTLLYDTLGDYPAAVRLIADEQHVPFIDLHAMSGKIISSLGTELSKKAFVHFPAGTYPGQPKDVKDDTHFSSYGAYELARCVVEGIRSSIPALATRIAPEVTRYNPESPSGPADFSIPPSAPLGEVRIPDGDGR
jgi:lysophospholipase L1-like esterase